MARVTLEALSVVFDDVRAVDGVSLDIEEGEFIVLLGPSGCGKTTTLRAIAGLQEVTAGSIRFNGQAVEGLSPKAREVAMVFQFVALYPHLSVRENIGFGPRMKGNPGSEIKARVDELLGIVGLQDFGSKMIYELSGGMQQRVALARCLANDPEVILMDEPLGALDALTREKMQGLVLKLWKETGKTIILITHSVEEALLLGERLLVMAPRPGRIHTEYRLPFAELGVGADLREVKKHADFGPKRDEILSMIWDMEEEIMGRTESAA